MTTREDLRDRLYEAEDLISDQTLEDLHEQSKRVAANLLVGVGDKALLTGMGIVLAAEQIHEAALTWLLAEGYVELTEKGRAPSEEVEQHKKARAARDAKVEKQRGEYRKLAGEDDEPDSRSQVGAYL